MNKLEQAKATCEAVLDGIECNTIPTSSALLQCLRIARLLGDADSVTWLQYEYGGYPRSSNGHITTEGWRVAEEHGRQYFEKGSSYVFTNLVSELEVQVSSNQSAIGNFTTNGVSVGGDNASIAMGRLTETVAKSTGNLISRVELAQKRLSILKGQYYDYALKKHIELSFGSVATDVFTEYRAIVDDSFSALSKDTLLKLQAIEDTLNSDNPEFYSQALTTCRRLFECTANELFARWLPNHTEAKYKTKSGTEIDVSGDHYKNKLSAVIEVLEDKTVKNSIVGSNIVYLLDWIDNLMKLQSKGVHHDISRQDAARCIIQTYVCLGDILNLQKGVTCKSEE